MTLHRATVHRRELINRMQRHLIRRRLIGRLDELTVPHVYAYDKYTQSNEAPTPARPQLLTLFTEHMDDCPPPAKCRPVNFRAVVSRHRCRLSPARILTYASSLTTYSDNESISFTQSYETLGVGSSDNMDMLEAR